ncbi:related to laccase precursor [Phialocephala subalpina]|uniref:laccase n=1 Tax=Phialocephala subalpina TaxID=576137 RepID=A0A1L7WVA8_9HELO|nr:related to laccase precursor [Phialocephala subalpina]
MFISSLFLAASALSTAFAAPSSSLASTSKLSKRCTNSASDRACWGDYDLSTNYYDTVPDTGVTREYWFEVQNGTAAPDGVERIVLTVNGTVPGPTIIADWGDTVVVHVTNAMENNGTGIHFHGIRQNYTNYMDGVPSITQCPIAPGDSFTYTWRATQYGSSWYHSHFAVQAWDGIFGGILINGPATANYDEDKGNLFLNDWSHSTAEVLADEAATSGPPTLDNCLINGTNVYDDSGSRFETDFVSGTSYRLRLVNGAADTHFKFSIDNHTLQVISTDFVPIVPYNTTMVSIGMGQRYDVIVIADQAEGDYWMRAIPQESCSDNDNVDNILGIVRYDSTSTSDPTSTAYTYSDSCDDEDISTLVPYLSNQVGTSPSVSDTFTATLSNGGGAILWKMGDTSFVNDWDYPTVLQVAEGNDTWTSEQNIIELDTADQWVYFVIETTFAQAHPIHLHGHDFWVLAQGTGTYDSSTVTLTTTDGPRRDVAMLPASGYLVLAYYTDNPGAWLMHCHIAWHASEGFALQLLERESEMVALMDVTSINSTCANWDTYTAEEDIVQDDSGI